MTPKPDYVRVVDHITARIESGLLKPGDRLPTYGRLAAEYEVGISTIAGAIRLLKERGLVVGQSGKATFVAGRKDDSV